MAHGEKAPARTAIDKQTKNLNMVQYFWLKIESEGSGRGALKRVSTFSKFFC
jgi:hypothetical protein